MRASALLQEAYLQLYYSDIVLFWGKGGWGLPQADVDRRVIVGNTGIDFERSQLVQDEIAILLSLRCLCDLSDDGLFG